MDVPDCPDISFFMLTFRTGVGMIIGLRFGPGIRPGTMSQDFRPGLRARVPDCGFDPDHKTIIQERIRRGILRRERIRIPCF